MKTRNTKIDNDSFVMLRTLQTRVAKEAAKLADRPTHLPARWYATLICVDLKLFRRALVINGVIRYTRHASQYDSKIAFVEKMFERQFAKLNVRTPQAV
jgi:hypothetical protein